MKRMYSKYFGGIVIDVKIVSFDKLPNKARYEYTDEIQNIDVYLYTDINQRIDTFYGVAW